MSIAHSLSKAGLFVITDSQAKHRITDTPQELRVTHFGSDDILATVAEAASVYPAPVALVLKTGQVMVLSEYGKGGIGIQGVEGQETEAQLQSVNVAKEVLTAFFGLAPAPKKRTKATVVVVEPEAEVASEAEPTEEI
jgi:hypothetical protein